MEPVRIDRMTRRELIQRLVLNSISDDGENVDQVILRDAVETGAMCGLSVERSDVVEALGELVGQGLARAYRLSATEPSIELPGMPPLDVVEEYFTTYFFITEKGMDLHLADDSWWPFDEEREPRV